MQKWKIKALMIVILIIEIINFIVLLFLPKTEAVAAGMKGTFFLRWAIWIAVLYVFIINGIAKKQKQIKVPSNYYNQEINDTYTPAMASFIIDKETEEKEAFLATILDLQAKKYLKIDKTGDYSAKIVVINDEIENLYSHEIYTLDCLKNVIDLDLNEFEKCIRNDCKDAKLIIIKGTIFEKIILFLVYLFFTLMFVGDVIETFSSIRFSHEFILAYMLIYPFFIYTISAFASPYKRTTKGIDFAIEMQGLKNYLRDHTLINEKDIDYTQLADRYMAYSIALGEAEKIEDKYMINAALETRYFGKR